MQQELIPKYAHVDVVRKEINIVIHYRKEKNDSKLTAKLKINTEINIIDEKYCSTYNCKMDINLCWVLQLQLHVLN